MEHYELRVHDIGEGCKCKTLTGIGKADFLEKWAEDYRKQETLTNLLIVLRRIAQRGTADMAKSSKLSPVKHESHLFEIKHFDGNTRVMAHIENDIILLLPYIAHKGGNSNNDKRMMKRAKQLNQIACKLIVEERRTTDE